MSILQMSDILKFCFGQGVQMYQKYTFLDEIITLTCCISFMICVLTYIFLGTYAGTYITLNVPSIYPGR